MLLQPVAEATYTQLRIPPVDIFKVESDFFLIAIVVAELDGYSGRQQHATRLIGRIGALAYSGRRNEILLAKGFVAVAQELPHQQKAPPHGARGATVVECS